MLTTVRGLLVLALLAVGTVPAAAGPVKHWAEFPGREIRAIALRGDLAGESYATVVPAADGWIYVRGKGGLYRLLGTDGTSAKSAAFDWCDDGQSKAVVRYATPAFACVAKNFIIEIKDGVQYRRALPRPAWNDPHDVYTFDYPFVTWIDREAGGRWWFSYGYARGLGYSDASGSTRLVHLRGIPPVRTIARAGNDLYLAADGCVLARVRAMRVQGRTQLCASPIAPQLIAAGGFVWVLTYGTTVERRDARGRSRRWNLSGVAVNDVAYDAASGTAYLLGGDSSRHNVLVTIGHDDVPHAKRLPMTGGSRIAVDRRGRIWITSPFEHSLVAIAPAGSWG